VPRYKLTIAYDGTDFHGWQRQEMAVRDGMPMSPKLPADAAARDDGVMVLRTVQDVVQRAVRETVREPVQVVGASRSDAGVHARGQVASFVCSGDEGAAGSGWPSEEVPGNGTPLKGNGEEPAGTAGLPEADAPKALRGVGWPVSRGAERLMRALNSRLPDDVQVVGSEVVGLDFNPIKGATSKSYSYMLHVALPPPMGEARRALWSRRYVHQLFCPLDVDRMNEAAAVLVGEHDFAGFAAAGHGRLSTVRTVFSCGVTELSGEAEGTRRVRIEVVGNGFLWNMVRIIGGTLVEAGRGRKSLDDIRAALASGDRRLAGPTLPPTGLCLEWIKYGG
jgi:tRNA pseudouridine38-40 synthase